MNITYSKDNAMNKSSWTDFWAAMPPEMKLLLGVVLGAIIRFLKNTTLALGENFTSSVVAAMAGYALTFGFCKLPDPDWDFGEYWYLGSIVAYMANHLLNGADLFGRQFAESPVKVVISVLSEVVDLGIEKYNKYFKKQP